MFYDPNIVNCKILCEVWKAGNNIKENCEEEISIPEICSKLDPLIASEEENVHRRLSLRTSSTMINGATKMLKRKLDNLLEDVRKMDADIIFRNKIRRSCEHRSGLINFIDSSTNSTEDRSGSSTRHSSEEVHQLINETRTNPSLDNQCDNCISEKQYHSSRADKEVQASIEQQQNNNSTNENQAFGLMFIHKNVNSIIPSRLMFVAINKDVINLN